MKIWLDDLRDAPNDSWTVARTVQDAFDLLLDNCGFVEEVSLDHDLGETDILTGYDFVNILEGMVGTGEMRSVILPDKFSIHSANPVGRKNMQAAIDSIERIRKWEAS